MATSTAKTPDAYVASLPRERASEIAKIRALVNSRIQPGFEEGMQYGMLSWYVPLSRLADTYNGHPFALACLASQKNYMALYLMCAYASADAGKHFAAAYRKSGKKLDMGKACIRFKAADDLAVDVIGDAIAGISVDQWAAVHDKVHGKKSKSAKPKATISRGRGSSRRGKARR